MLIKIIEILIRYNGAIVSGKALMKAVGIDCVKCRVPLRNLTVKEYAEFIAELDKAGFLR